MCAYGFSCSRRKRGDGGRPAGRRRPGRQRERGGRVGVVRGRGGPRLRSLGRPCRCVGAQAARLYTGRRRGRCYIGVPCQPPPVPPNATTSPRDGLRAPVQAAHRPPSRGRRRRDNDRPTPPGPACRGGFLAVATHNSARGDLHPAGGDPKRRLFTFAFSETLRAPLPKPLAVVKWSTHIIQTRPPWPCYCR